MGGATAAENMIVQEGEAGAGELEVRDGTSGAGPGNVAGGSVLERGVGDSDGDGEDDLLPELERMSWIAVSARITDSLRFEPWLRVAGVLQN